jgi:hypothetical protein
MEEFHIKEHMVVAYESVDEDRFFNWDIEESLKYIQEKKKEVEVKGLKLGLTRDFDCVQFLLLKKI